MLQCLFTTCQRAGRCSWPVTNREFSTFGTSMIVCRRIHGTPVKWWRVLLSSGQAHFRWPQTASASVLGRSRVVAQSKVSTLVYRTREMTNLFVSSATGKKVQTEIRLTWTLWMAFPSIKSTKLSTATEAMESMSAGIKTPAQSIEIRQYSLSQLLQPIKQMMRVCLPTRLATTGLREQRASNRNSTRTNSLSARPRSTKSGAQTTNPKSAE